MDNQCDSAENGIQHAGLPGEERSRIARSKEKRGMNPRLKALLVFSMSAFYLIGFLVTFWFWGYVPACLFAVAMMVLYAFIYPYRNIR